MKKKEALITEFRVMYGRLPWGLRTEIVAVIDDEPLTFRVIYDAIENKNPIGLKALRQMERIGLFTK